MKTQLLDRDNKVFKLNQQIPENVAIAIREVSKKYYNKEEYSVKNIDLNILKGQFHAFVGPNGAGKTTTMKIIIGAIQKFTGQVYINQISNKSATALAKIAYIPEVALFPTQMSLKEFLEWNGRMIGLKGQLLKNKVTEIVDKLNLNSYLRKNPENFSSGEQKKVFLAQALLKGADIFVLDEPAANLDPQTRLNLLEFMKQLQKEGKTILISSHVLSEIEEYVDSVTIIEKGKIILSGLITDFSEKDKHLYDLVPINEQQLIDFLQKEKLHFIKKGAKISVTFASSQDFEAFLKRAAKKDVLFKYIDQNKMRLKDIYSKHILKDGK